MLTDLIESVSCPNCGATGFETIYPASYPEQLDRAQVLEVYSASSSHKLFDSVVRCSGCSLVYLNPRFRQELILESYAGAVDPTFVAQNDLRIRTFRRSLDDLVERRVIPAGAGTRVLDIGCAGGAFPKAAHDAGFQVVGVEPSRWLSEFGRKTYGVDIRTGFLNDQSFEPASFDVITLWDVIEHLPDPRMIMTEVRQLLKPGGVLIVNYPDYGSMARQLLRRNWPMFLSVHLTYFTPATLRAFLSSCGFETQSVRPFWQTLELGYALRRAGQYFRPFDWLSSLSGMLGLAKFPLTYNIGQSLMVARKGPAS
jgi:2-polyprenyl-3-methyl-5-hydroxy-6-metoxy-1,4-benzoquinol methylase